MTGNVQNFSPPAPQTTENAPSPKKGWSSWLSSGCKRAVTPLGEGLGDGLVSKVKEVKEDLTQWIQPGGPFANQLKQALEQALLMQPPEELLPLPELLNDLLSNPSNMGVEKVKSIHARLTLLSENDNELLKQLAPNLSDEELALCQQTFGAINAVADAIEVYERDEGNIEELWKNLGPIFEEEETRKGLEAFHALLNNILKHNHGALIHIFEFATHKLKEKDGPLDYIDERLTQLLNKAANILETKLDQTAHHLENRFKVTVETLDRKMTEEVHPLLSTSLTQLIQLRKAVIDNKRAAIQTTSKTLEPLLEQLLAQSDAVFSKQALTKGRLLILEQLKNQLPYFYTDPLPTQRELMASPSMGSVEVGISIIDGYYKSHAGVAPRLGHTLREAVSDTFESLLPKLDETTGRLENRVKATVESLDMKMTQEVHPLVSKSRTQLIHLRKAMIDNNKPAIQSISKILQPLVEQMLAQSGTVFSKQALSRGGLLLLQELKDQLPYFYTNPSPDHMKSVEVVIAIIDNYYKNYAGVAPRLGDTITDALDPILTRVENLLPTMAGRLTDHFFGRNPSSSSVPGTEGAASGEGTVSQFLAYGGSVLKGMIETGKEGVSKQALASFAGVLSFGLSKVHDKMGDSPAYVQPKETLQGIISCLGTLPTTGNWNQLYETLVETSKLLQDIHICVNGFRIPIPQIGPVPREEKIPNSIDADNAALLQSATNPLPASPHQDYKKLTRKEIDTLIGNTVNLLTLKHIFERVCGLTPPDEKFYLRLLAEARKKQDQPDKELKRLFFEELDKSNINFITRTSAKVIYFFYGKLFLKRFVSNAIDIYFDEIFKYIEGHRADKFDTLRHEITTNYTRFLTILGGAYKAVAKRTNPTGTIDEMVREELEKKESNLGFESKELYGLFAQSVISKAIPFWPLAWIVTKLIGNPETVVRMAIDKATGSLQDTLGYTHALNTVISEQLDEVLRMLQTPSDDEHSDKAALLSSVKKEQLASLVKNQFEILRKAKCRTLDELSDLVDGKLLSAKVNQAVDDLFIEEVLEEVTNILAIAVQSLLKEEHLQKLTYKFAMLANRAFEVGEESVTPERMHDEENYIAKRSEQILSLAINSAIDKKFDFSGKKQQEETNNYIRELHEHSQEYFATAATDLAALALEEDVTSDEAIRTIKTIVEEAEAYVSTCQQSKLQAHSSQMSSANKEEIKKRYLQVAAHSKPFIEAVVELKQHAQTIENSSIVVPHLGQIVSITSKIMIRLYGNLVPTLEDALFAEKQMKILEIHLQKLSETQLTAELVEEMTAEIRAIGNILASMKNAIKGRTLSLKLTQKDSLLDQIVDQKKRYLGIVQQNTLPKGKIPKLKRELLQHASSIDASLLPQLLNQLENIDNATLPQQIDTARQAFLGLMRQVLTQTTESINDRRAECERHVDKINAGIDETHFLDLTHSQRAVNGIVEATTRAQEHLKTISDWEAEEVKQVLYANFSVGDMKGLQDMTSRLVYARVKERLDGFMAFVKRPEIYHYGFVHHLFLAPNALAMRQGKK